MTRVRDRWITERGGVEAYVGRAVQPEDNGHVSGAHAARIFPVSHQPKRAAGGAPLTQLEYARAGIITKEMVYVAHRENMGRKAVLERAAAALRRRREFRRRHSRPHYARVRA